MDESANTVVKFTSEEITITMEGANPKEEIVLNRDQARDLVNMLNHIERILGDCEAYVGEIVGMPR